MSAGVVFARSIILSLRPIRSGILNAFSSSWLSTLSTGARVGHGLLGLPGSTVVPWIPSFRVLVSSHLEAIGSRTVLSTSTTFPVSTNSGCCQPGRVFQNANRGTDPCNQKLHVSSFCVARPGDFMPGSFCTPVCMNAKPNPANSHVSSGDSISYDRHNPGWSGRIPHSEWLSRGDLWANLAMSAVLASFIASSQFTACHCRIVGFLCCRCPVCFSRSLTWNFAVSYQ